ncbi:RNase H family protein [Deinococcus cellulosilyticus]|uniref:RNase H type-1 domain-containing protein n=1 Tax=Deinococcus cellulosilyticus (strain DSM 18568 / NBRC 106333 / KACC 11606 / 5516J-15) TaxID=1223518 RepID=A0A511NA49_DEIC1|nr:RNase H family protein [Deinococcus cellulosilyticus]GEM49705.1 hypothetical protein DC3_53400 [Deinococcus cellulosilyticus NBRC 106333 = KACC 11606]
MTTFTAYVDGSYSPEKHLAAAAWVILQDDEPIHQGKELVLEELSSRNITGELQAAIKVIDYCEAKGIQDITIFHDLEGTGYWARGEWKRKKPVTQAFYSRVQDSTVRINFQWIQGHSGHFWNETVDQMARKLLE